MADNKSDNDDSRADEPTLVERWLKDQQEWQRTAMAYLDALVKNDEFLVHLGNAMRGSLLAGKPYPGSQPNTEAANETAAASDDRIDEILHTLHRIEGELADLKMTVEDLVRAAAPGAARAASTGDPERGEA